MYYKQCNLQHVINYYVTNYQYTADCRDVILLKIEEAKSGQFHNQVDYVLMNQCPSIEMTQEIIEKIAILNFINSVKRLKAVFQQYNFTQLLEFIKQVATYFSELLNSKLRYYRIYDQIHGKRKKLLLKTKQVPKLESVNI